MEREERLLAMHGGRANAALWDICREGGGNDARFLLAHGADANYHRDEYGGACRVLWRAAVHGHLSIVEALLDAGADQRDEALLWSVALENISLVKILLDRGADLHYKDDTALFCAVRDGRIELVRLLLQRGATATSDLRDLAVERGDHEIAALLRAHGAV